MLKEKQKEIDSTKKGFKKDMKNMDRELLQMEVDHLQSQYDAIKNTLSVLTGEKVLRRT